MSSLEVDAIGLRMLAAHCQAWAAEVRIAIPLEPSGSTFQATAVAVDVVHAGVDSAGEALAGRLTSTAVMLTAASGNYSNSDEESAEQLHGVSREI